MGKLIRSMAATQEAAERAQFGPDGQPLNGGQIHPSQLDYCRVLYDFTPESNGTTQGVDLAVKKGDLVAVLSKSDPMGNASEWWRCRARDGRIGHLPGVYLAEVKKAAAAQPGGVMTQITAKGEPSRTSTMSSVGNGASGYGMQQAQPGFGMGGQQQQPPMPVGKAGDISAESFQKSQFYS